MTKYLLPFIAGCLVIWGTACMNKSQIPSLVSDLFPRTPAEITARADQAITAARTAVAELIAVPTEERTFENTFGALDRLGSAIGTTGSVLHAIQMVSPETAMRDAAAHEIIRLQQFTIDELVHNEAVYHACQSYVRGEGVQESLTPEQQFYVNETMRGFRRVGFDLPREQRKILAEKEKELASVQLAFSTLINTDRRTIIVDEKDLAGLDPAFIASLEKTDDGKRILPTDYPIMSAVLESCSVRATREAMWRAYVSVAYPKNTENLARMIELRDECAKLLGYESAARYDCEEAMVRSPERARAFLEDLLIKSQPKLNEELTALRAELPEGVELDAQNRAYPWDWAYIKAHYKLKHHALDEQKIAEYFPAEQTLLGLLEIYEEFFNCRFTQLKTEPNSFWHASVRLIEARRKDGELLGYLLLDLYPRPAKYTHACQMSFKPALRTRDGQTPAVALVIANFPAESADRPALLKHRDVTTFFHEFGHALHTLFGATTLASLSGTHVKTDFVELPSQMLEEWMYDPEMIKRVSRHYTTGAPLSDEQIEQIRAARMVDQGDFIVRQIGYALLSLDVYSAGAQKDIEAIKKSIHDRCRPYIVTTGDEHGECSFGHLTGYGAMYYSYLWSKVFALDLFAQIEKEGLLNPAAGKRYAESILVPGGSRDPEDLLRDYLGREPRSDAFFAAMGIEEKSVSPMPKSSYVEAQ